HFQKFVYETQNQYSRVTVFFLKHEVPVIKFYTSRETYNKNRAVERIQLSKYDHEGIVKLLKDRGFEPDGGVETPSR
ncbi:hypothetical protein SARC_11742, partial [Sphaeroforma arctica JP610]